MKFSRYGLRLQALRSNESPSGAFKQRDGLAQQDSKMEGPCPEKFPEKKNTAHAVQAKDFVGVKRRQNDRVCCGAIHSFWAIIC